MAKTLIEVLTEHDIELRETSGGRQVTRCVFHEGDNEASLTIYPNNTYYCFACHAWGDAVKFLVEYKHFTEKQALDYVGADYRTPKRDKAQVIKVKNTSQTFRFLHDVAMDYHEFLLQTPGAINYLQTRGLSTETIKKFKIGFTDGGVLKLQMAWEMQMALEIGLVNKNSYELMSQRITIPNITEDGQCDFLIGRTVANSKIKYLGATMPKPIHGFYAVRHSPILFIAEGQFDWLTLRQWGYPAAVLGGSAITKHNALLLQEKKLVLIPDYDETVGEQTMETLKQRFGENAMILDYRELQGNESKFDVSTLSESPGGELLFQTICEEQIGWLHSLSQRTLMTYFPSLAGSTNLALTQRLQV